VNSLTQTPSHVQTAIVGGGVIGCSIAYHLTKLGAADVALFERGVLTSGTSWHAAGLIMQLRSSHSMTALARYNVELYSALEAETGMATGFKQNGTLGLARTAERLAELRRYATIAKSFGIAADIIGPAEAQAIYPAIDHDLVEGAIFIAGDGQLNPVDTVMALATGARQGGARIFEQSPVTAIERLPSGAWRLTTSGGVTECENLVLSAGLWTRDLAATVGVNVALHACEHMYVVTEPLDFVDPGLPVLRDTDGYVYIKEDAGRLLVGAFEPQGKPLPVERLPAEQQFMELPEDWDHFALPYGKAMEIIPALEHAGIARFMNGPESFTPDDLFALGEAPGCPRLYIAAGFNSEGFEMGAGAGRALAQWIVAGEATEDLSDVDVARFHPFQNNRRYLAERAGESLGFIYHMHWPNVERESARLLRTSALHERLVARNACFGESLGWERAQWFAPPGTEPVNRYSFGRPNWFGAVGEECAAVRGNVGLFELSSFGKHLVQGRDACRLLQRLCASNMDVPVGKVVYTHMLNSRGGIEVDVTINRLAEERFMIVSSAAFQPRDRAWIERHFEANDHVTLTDVTSAYAVLSVQGPNARALLGAVTDADLSSAAFPYGTSREIEVGYATVIANRLSFVGEVGWELYIATDFARGVFDDIVAAGEAFDLRMAGYHALEHLRCERGFREFELDLTPDDTPFEAGLGFIVKLGKPGDFNGRGVLEAQHGKVLTKRLVLFKLDDPAPLLHRDEVIRRDGEIVGYISSGAYGYTVGASVGMGYVRHGDGVTDEFVEAGSFDIEIAGERFAAEASLRSFYDPDGKRARL
jgi:glycine cleavage system aminomethyltransferase T/glycine/D-amino acid oxidase-like deaminating enzyme